jgi:hypothetical protein
MYSTSSTEIGHSGSSIRPSTSSSERLPRRIIIRMKSFAGLSPGTTPNARGRHSPGFQCGWRLRRPYCANNEPRLPSPHGAIDGGDDSPTLARNYSKDIATKCSFTISILRIYLTSTTATFDVDDSHNAKFLLLQ